MAKQHNLSRLSGIGPVNRLIAPPFDGYVSGSRIL